MKLDITVTRDLTINMGNFNSIKPAVTIVGKDIDATRVEETMNDISNLLTALWSLEAEKAVSELSNARGANPIEYRKVIESRVDKCKEYVKKFTEKYAGEFSEF